MGLGGLRRPCNKFIGVFSYIHTYIHTQPYVFFFSCECESVSACALVRLCAF